MQCRLFHNSTILLELAETQGLAETILQGTVQGGRRRGRQKKRWENNISEWTGLKFCEALRECKTKSNGGKGLLVPWRPNGHHDYGIGARCKVQGNITETSFTLTSDGLTS